MTNISFRNFGTLPVPCEWMLQPEIETLPLGHHKAKRPGVIYVMDERKLRQRTWYSFRLIGKPETLERNVWRNWHATGWEDFEVGHAWISATYYDFDHPEFDGEKARVTWFVEFSHDGEPERYTGDPEGEFWGWIVKDVSVMHAFERRPRDKTPITYEYQCNHSNGSPVRFRMTGNGQYDCERKAKRKVDEDPFLKKWHQNHYFGGYSLVREEVKNESN